MTFTCDGSIVSCNVCVCVWGGGGEGGSRKSLYALSEAKTYAMVCEKGALMNLLNAIIPGKSSDNQGSNSQCQRISLDTDVDRSLKMQKIDQSKKCRLRSACAVLSRYFLQMHQTPLCGFSGPEIER